MNTDEEDRDWEEEARQAEAEEKRLEVWKRAAACMHKSRRTVVVSALKPKARLVVTMCEEDEDPLAVGPIEFTIVDPASGKVRVKDRHNFTEPTEGTLLGCEDNEAITPGTLYPCRRVLLPGTLRPLCWLVYEVDGRRVDLGPHTMSRIEIYQPGMADPFVLPDDA